MKKLSFRLISALLAAVFIFSSSSAAIALEYAGTETIQTESIKNFKSPSPEYYDVLEKIVDTKKLRPYLFERLRKCQATIDISEYNISADNSDYLKSYIWYEMVDAFHVYSLGGSIKNGKLTTLYVGYLLNANEFSQYYDASIKAAKSITDDIKNSSLDICYKALIVHDRLINHCQYYDGTKLDSTMAGALADGAAVCSGYSRAYKYLMNSLGISCSLCQSDALNHEWNILTINGQKYHVDTTWDDTYPDRFGRVLHDNFLRSTKGLKANGHDADDFNSSPVSETYDSAYWQNSETEFQYKNGRIYYFDTQNKELCSYGKQKETLLKVPDKWYTSYGSYYPKSYVCLDSDDDKYNLYYSTPDTIFRYNIILGTSEAVYTPEKPAKGFNIYGFKIKDNYFYIDSYDSPEISERSTYSFKVKYKSDEDYYAKPEVPVIEASNVAKSGKIKISWNKINNASSYLVYRSTSRNGTYKLMKETTSLSYINTSAAAGKTYYYKVCSVSPDGVSSDFSEIKYRTCDLARPEVTASNVASTGKVKLTWPKIDGAVSYRVYRSTTKNGTYKLMKTTTSLSYTNTSSTAGTAYYYKVKAVAEKSAADSAYSSVKTRTCDLPKPSANISLNKSNKPYLSWSRIDGAASYEIYRSTSKNGTYSLIGTTLSSGYTDTSAKSGKTYCYKIKAMCRNSNGNSAYSSVVSIKVK